MDWNSNETSEYHLFCSTTTIHDITPQQPWYSVTITYVLDIDGDSDTDWEIIEYIELSLLAGQNPATIRLDYTIGQIHLQNWVGIQTIEVPFRIDADVYDTPSNNFYFTNPVTHVTTETWVNAQVRTAWVARTNVEPVRSIEIHPNPGMNPNSQLFYFVKENGANEFSQHPSNYLDSESLQDDNGVVWYIEAFNVNNGNGNIPPTLNLNGQWNGIIIDDFDA